MNEIQIVLTVTFILGGIFFLLVGSIGLIRMPGFYSRTHATSKSDTLGLLMVITGLIIYEGWHLNSVKLGLILLFIALTNPIGSHALARSAFETGIKPLFNKNSPEEENND